MPRKFNALGELVTFRKPALSAFPSDTKHNSEMMTTAISFMTSKTCLHE